MVETALYCVTLEALQYAGPDARVDITLSHSPDQVGVVVDDDGVGFDIDTLTAGGGHRNMEDRLGAVDGTLEIRSTPCSGVSVAASVPVRDHELSG